MLVNNIINARDAVVGQYISACLHEINQPLNAIKIGADGILLKNEFDPNAPLDKPKTIKVIEQISRSIDAVDLILKQIAKYLDNNALEQKSISCVNEMFENCYRLFHTKCSLHGIDIIVEKTPNCIKNYGYWIVLEMIINNYFLVMINLFDISKNKYNKSISMSSSTFRNGVVVELSMNNKYILNTIHNGIDEVKQRFEIILAKILADYFEIETEFFVKDGNSLVFRSKFYNGKG